MLYDSTKEQIDKIEKNIEEIKEGLSDTVAEMAKLLYSKNYRRNADEYDQRKMRQTFNMMAELLDDLEEEYT